MNTQNERRYVVCPNLDVESGPDNDTVKVLNRAFTSGFVTSPELLVLLEFMRTPRTRSEILTQFEVAPEVIDQLEAQWIVLPHDELELLRNGLVRAPQMPVGRSCSLQQLTGLSKPGAFGVFGAPVDLLGMKTTQQGPKEVRSYSNLRVAELSATMSTLPRADSFVVDLERRATFSLGETESEHVFDLGDVAYESGEQIATFGQRVARVADMICDHEMTPVMIGGDHSHTWYVLNALMRRYPRVGVIHFDAHHDIYGKKNHVGLSHANPFALVLKQKSLVRLHQLGLRTVERQPLAHTSKCDDQRVTYHSARELQRLEPAEAFATLDTTLPYYLSFDIDCVCPEEAGETGSPVVGGISFYQAYELVDYAVRRFNLIGADFMEVEGPRDPRFNNAAAISARLMDLVLTSRLKPSPLDSYLYEANEWYSEAGVNATHRSADRPMSDG